MAAKKLMNNVIMAIKDQNEFNGSTVKQIVGFMKSNSEFSKIPKTTLMSQVKNFVKQATLKGLLKGFHGRYRIDVNQGKSQSYLRRHGENVSKRSHRKKYNSRRGKKQHNTNQNPCDRNSYDAKTCKRKAAKTHYRGVRRHRTRQASPSGFVHSIEDLELAGQTLLKMASEMRTTAERRAKRCIKPTNGHERRAATTSRENLLIQRGRVAPLQRRQQTPFTDSDNEYGGPDHDDDYERMVGNFQKPVPYYQHGEQYDEQLPSTSQTDGYTTRSSYNLNDRMLRRVCQNTLSRRQGSMADLTEDTKSILSSISVSDLITQVRRTFDDNDETWDDDDASTIKSSSSLETIINSGDEVASINGADYEDSIMDNEDEQSEAQEVDKKVEDAEGDHVSDEGKNTGDNDEANHETAVESMEEEVEGASAEDNTEVDDKETVINVVTDEEKPEVIVPESGDVPLIGDPPAAGAQDAMAKPTRPRRRY